MEPYVIGPHGQFEVTLAEDAAKAGDRIYFIKDRYEPDQGIGMVGEEISCLVEWWRNESARPRMDVG